MLTSVKECEQKQPNASTSAETVSEMPASEEAQSDRVITYEANTRGFYEKIWMDGNTLKFTNDRQGLEVQSKELSKTQKADISKLLNSVELKTLSQLESSSKAHQYDGAAMATVEITSGKSSYKTKTFDHGNPPGQLKPLVEKLLSLKAMMVKD